MYCLKDIIKLSNIVFFTERRRKLYRTLKTLIQIRKLLAINQMMPARNLITAIAIMNKKKNLKRSKNCCNFRKSSEICLFIGNLDRGLRNKTAVVIVKKKYQRGNKLERLVEL